MLCYSRQPKVGQSMINDPMSEAPARRSARFLFPCSGISTSLYLKRVPKERRIEGRARTSSWHLNLEFRTSFAVYYLFWPFIIDPPCQVLARLPKTEETGNLGIYAGRSLPCVLFLPCRKQSLPNSSFHANVPTLIPTAAYERSAETEPTTTSGALLLYFSSCSKSMI